MAKLESQLVLSLLDRVTAPVRGITATLDRLTSAQNRNNARLNAIRGSMLEAGAVAYGLARAVSAPVKAAMEFESAMADVRKVVDFPTPAAFKEMSSQIVEMSTRIPIAATGIAEIVAAAGQAGMAGNELLAFSEMAAKVGVAFDMTAGDVGEALAKIKTQLNISVADTGALADAINHLSNTSASAAPAIVDYMKRVAATGEFYGFTATQTAAIGSAMIAAGAEAEVAATSFRNVGRALAKGDSATKRQSAAFKQLGLDVSEVAKRFNEDAVGTLRDVIVRINSLPAHLRANALSEIFGDEARALAPLVGQIELYDNALASVAARATYLGSSQKEFEVRSETTANALQLLRNKISAVGIAIGSALLPAVNSIADALGPVILALARFADQNPRLTATVVSLAAGLVALRVAAIAAQFGFLWMKGGLLSAAITGMKGLRAAVLGVGGAFRIAGAAAASGRAAILGATMLGAVGGGGLFSGIVASAGGAVTSVLTIFGTLAAGIATITAPIWGTIAAVVAAVAGLALAIYNYWVPISEFIGGFVSVVGGALSGIVSEIAAFGGRIASAVGGWAVDRVVDFAALIGIDEATVRAAVDMALAAISSFASSVVSAIKAIPAAVGNWFGDIFTMNTYSAAATAGFRSSGEAWGRALVEGISSTFSALSGKITALVPQMLEAGRALGQAIYDGIVGLIDQLANYISSKLSGALSSVGNFASGLASRVGSWVGLGEGGNPAPDGQPVEARASGGPVRSGRPYLIGERGPELMVPQHSGYVVPNHMMGAVGGGTPTAPAQPAQGRGDVTVNMGGFTINQQPGESSDRLAERMAAKVQAALASHYSDGAYA